MYDAVFIGSSLISLTAATVLTRKNQSVLFFPSLDISEPSLFDFTLGPLLYMGLPHGEEMESLLSHLSLPMNALSERSLKKATPLLQLLQSFHRVDLFSGKEAYRQTLQREFFGDTSKIASFFPAIEREERWIRPLPEEAPEKLAGKVHLLWKTLALRLNIFRKQRNRAAAFMAPFAFGADFIEHLNLLSLFGYRKRLSAISEYQLILLLSEMQKSGGRWIGGFPAVEAFFLKLIQEGNGNILKGAKIATIKLNGRKIEGLSLEDGTYLPCRHLIVTETPQESEWTFYFKIRKEWIPSPMGENMVMTWEEAPPFLENILIIRMSLPEEEKRVKGKYRGLSATCLIRVYDQATPFQAEDIKTMILKKLHWLIPFSESEIQEAQEDRRYQETSPLPLSVKRQIEEAKTVRNLSVIENDLSMQLGWSSHLKEAMALACRLHSAWRPSSLDKKPSAHL